MSFPAYNNKFHLQNLWETFRVFEFFVLVPVLCMCVCVLPKLRKSSRIRGGGANLINEKYELGETRYIFHRLLENSA